MPKLIDPKSGERKFYKGPGRNKDRNLGLYDRLISDSSRVTGSSQTHTASEHRLPDVPKWKGQPPNEVKRKRKKPKLRKPVKVKNTPGIDAVPYPKNYWRADDNGTTTT